MKTIKVQDKTTPMDLMETTKANTWLEQISET